ncbi:MAG: transglycosylase domain-containing protein [Bacteroidales bacterium]|nr:transglycosylase domain-containing protein [Bacteroidales bacterium]
MDKRKTLQIGLYAAAAIPVVIALIVFIRACCLLESKNELRHIKNATASVVLSQEGELTGKIFKENRTSITYDQISEDLIQALLSTEDARFYNHSGVDTRSLFRVFFKTLLLRRESAGGGSTITQQLAKNLFGRNIRGPFALLTIKSKEVMLARRLEKLFSKEEILTLYLNTVPFGENIYGIETAAQRYFNTKVELLKTEESAVLIGMLKANSLYNPRIHPDKALKRRNIVFRQMQKYGYLNPAAADSLCLLPLELDYANLETNGPADYFVYQVKQEVKRILKQLDSPEGKKWNLEEDGLIITTTLNLHIQRFANQAFRKHLSVMQNLLERQYQSKSGKKYIDNQVKTELKWLNRSNNADEKSIRQVFSWDGIRSDSMTLADSIRQSVKLLQAGLLAVDPRTGAIKAWVGGIDFKTNPYDQVTARRQMGSVFKPVLFAAALEMGYTPCHYLDNDSITIKGYDDWHPQNFDHSVGGKYSLNGALMHSMNIPAVNLYLETGFDRIDTLWKKLGFSFQLVNAPSLALGTAEANIEEVAVAYAAFANGGYRVNPQMILSIKTRQGEVIWQNELPDGKVRVLSERTSLLMNTMLRNVVRAGTGSPLRSRFGVEFPLAGKTGTTQDYSDAWFAAYCPSLVMVSRVGCSMPAIRFNSSANGTGSALALPLAALTLKTIQDNPVLAKKTVSVFPLSDQELERELSCPDFRESAFLDDLMDILKRREIDYEQARKKAERRKRPFFRRFRW